MQPKCLNCSDPFVGRIDKKFCCDQCRNTYNNRIKRNHEKNILDINRILRKNRKILKQFNPEGETTIHKESLDKMGFNYKYHTHAYSSSTNNEYLFCYEYGYLIIADEKVLIINHQTNMDK